MSRDLWQSSDEDLKGLPEFSEADEVDDCPIQILKLAKEVCDYYEAPQMNATTFESKLFRLQAKVSAELKKREEMTKIVTR